MAFIFVMALVLGVCSAGGTSENQEHMRVLTVWQIDGFEGGKGSRAQYLQDKGEECFKGTSVYVKVVSVSSDAARKNLSAGVLPDIISYPAGFYGLESYIPEDYSEKTWCRGGYCLITLGENADFSDARASNTVVNAGKDNLAKVAALSEGFGGAAEESSVSAYLELIKGEYKYLLGTQRDIYRLTTRGETFSVKALTTFNDLYQNIGVLCGGEDKVYAQKFISFLENNCEDVTKIGMISDATKYAGAMDALSKAEVEYALKTFVGEDYIKSLKNAAESGDINLVKSLLK